MTFSIIERPGPRAEVAENIREGCHHKKGEHTLLDMHREQAAELVEHTGNNSSIVGCTISGHSAKNEDGSYDRACITIDAYLCSPGDTEYWDNNQDPSLVLENTYIAGLSNVLPSAASPMHRHGAEVFDVPPDAPPDDQSERLSHTNY